MFTELGLGDLLDVSTASIDDFSRVQGIIKDFQPEIIFHLAAQSLVRESYLRPLETLRTNIMGTAHMLEACRHVPSARAIVIVTSDKCYRNNEWVWGYRENDPMGGHDPYSASKGCAELITASYIKSFFPADQYGLEHQVAIASARAGNAIGGGDWGKDRLIPDCFRALHAGRPVLVRYPRAVRPWQHVLECLAGYLQLGGKLFEEGIRFGCGWNFAPLHIGDVWPVEDVVRYICSLWEGGRYEVHTGKHPYEAKMLCLDCTKANIELGWRPRYKVAEALRVTTDWYRAWTRSRDAAFMRDFTLEQIERYINSRPHQED